MRTAPERQQTLRAAVDWSYELCTPEEQAVWCRASVFAGTFDIDAAGNVCSDRDLEPDEVLDVVDALLDKSVLLREDAADRVRYRMLETVREYGQERLAEAGDEERVERRHRDWFDQLTEAADAEWMSPQQVEWIGRLRADHANIRAALAWSIRRPDEAGVALRMAGRLGDYRAGVRGLPAEAQLWLDRALAAAPADHPDRALAATAAAMHSLWLAKLDDAHQRLDIAAELARGRDDEILNARITHVRAFESMLRIQPGTAALAVSAAATFRKHGLQYEAHALFIQGVASAYEGDLKAARSALRRMVDLAESHGEAYYHGMAYFGIVLVEVEVEVDFGDGDAAAEAALQALRWDMGIGARAAIGYRIDALAWVADRQGDHQRAATLFGAAATIWDAIGSTAEIAVSIPHRKHLKSTRKALGADRLARTNRRPPSPTRTATAR